MVALYLLFELFASLEVMHNWKQCKIILCYRQANEVCKVQVQMTPLPPVEEASLSTIGKFTSLFLIHKHLCSLEPFNSPSNCSNILLIASLIMS